MHMRRSRQFTLAAGAVLLTVAGQFFYLGSLAEADPVETEAWLKANLPWLGLQVLLSTVCFALGFAAALFLPLGRRASCALLGWCLLSMLLLLGMTNHEASQRMHGAYNFAGFVILVTPQLLVVFASRICCGSKYSRHIAVIVASVIFCITALVARSVHHSTAGWERGLFGTQLRLSNPGCTTVKPRISLAHLWSDFVDPTFGRWSRRPCTAEPAFSRRWSGSELIDATCDDETEFMLLPTLKGQLGSMIAYVQDRAVFVRRKGPFNLTTEAAVVTCGKHRNLHLRVPRDHDAVMRVSGRPPPKEDVPLAAPNIVVIFVDALSRNDFFRKLPTTMHLLENVHGDANSPADVFQLMLYHSLSFHTRPNTLAMFTGEAQPPDSPLTLWELLRPRYVTAIVDNTCLEWSAKYLHNRSAVADHRLNAPWCLPEYAGVSRDEQYPLLYGAWSVQRRCIAGRAVHEWAFEYGRRFIDAYPDLPKFLMLKFTEAHEPSYTVANVLDTALAQFLATLDLNTTAVVLLSDHGYHMGLLNIMDTWGSILENHRPGWFMVLPKWWLAARGDAEENLRANEQSLVTPFSTRIPETSSL
eukprot:TRINITY_DN942_c0_g1_i1.p1 TRINITY_DN942_c0_g1~~TRINITY_DN942_c0_g1_i1.p1  ORF type:complete len:593 (-),score=122.44 TRINITY_DN942_c0_g1_i1:1334-3091(-)